MTDEPGGCPPDKSKADQEECAPRVIPRGSRIIQVCPKDLASALWQAERAANRPSIDDLRWEETVATAECIFCKIVAGTEECHELYRDETTLAFMDIHPANEGHCLVIRAPILQPCSRCRRKVLLPWAQPWLSWLAR